MNHEDRLSELLKSLPRERAADGFTGELLTRMADSSVRPRINCSFAFAVVGVCVTIAFGLVAGWRLIQDSKKERLVRECVSIRIEYSEIHQEYGELRQEIRARQVFYLGGSDQAEYVFDLANFKDNAPLALTPPNELPAGEGHIDESASDSSTLVIPYMYRGDVI